MSVKEFNKLNKEQLESKLKDYKDSLVNYRFQKVLQQLENPFDIRFTKRKIARRGSCHLSSLYVSHRLK